MTTGTDWKFVRLEATAKIARVDLDIYVTSGLPRLLGILCRIVDAALVEVADLMPPP